MTPIFYYSDYIFYNLYYWLRYFFSYKSLVYKYDSLELNKNERWISIKIKITAKHFFQIQNQPTDNKKRVWLDPYFSFTSHIRRKQLIIALKKTKDGENLTSHCKKTRFSVFFRRYNSWNISELNSGQVSEKRYRKTFSVAWGVSLRIWYFR